MFKVGHRPEFGLSDKPRDARTKRCGASEAQGLELSVDDAKKGRGGSSEEGMQQRVDALFGAINASVQEGGEPLLSNQQMERLMDPAAPHEEKISVLTSSRFGDLIQEAEAIKTEMNSQRPTLWERCKDWFRRK